MFGLAAIGRGLGALLFGSKLKGFATVAALGVAAWLLLGWYGDGRFNRGYEAAGRAAAVELAQLQGKLDDANAAALAARVERDEALRLLALRSAELARLTALPSTLTTPAMPCFVGPDRDVLDQVFRP